MQLLAHIFLSPKSAGAMSQSFLRCRLLLINAKTCGMSSCVSQFNRALSTHNQFLNVSEEVQDAIHTGKPVVALETTIYTHGFPHPENIALASRLESLVRTNGGIPATIGVLNGIAKVGFAADELIELLESAGRSDTRKLSRRDLAYICGLGVANHKLNGGTTVAGTMVLAHLAGIKVFATGGLGGVHKGGESTMDISADLTELGRTPVAVISSGCKSFLDIPKTLEFLETQGVGVSTFADGRTRNIDFPAFWTRDSGVRSPKVVQDEKQAAAIIYAQKKFPINSGLLFANPIAEERSLDKAVMEKVMAEAIHCAKQSGNSGSDETPFILAKIREITGGATVGANIALVEANVERGTKVAVELAELEAERGKAFIHRSFEPSVASSAAIAHIPQSSGSDYSLQSALLVDVLVAGSLAIDTSFTFNPISSADHVPDTPAASTSNPAIMSHGLGGVGQNIASALHYLGTPVQFCSIVADDSNGKTAISMLANRGLRVNGIEVLKDGSCTAQYTAFNDKKNELVMAMADMRILETRQPHLEALWMSHLERCNPKWLIADTNWDPQVLRYWLTTAKSKGIKTAVEPVSVLKSRRIFESLHSSMDKVVSLVDLVTPNQTEVAEMHSCFLDCIYKGFADSLFPKQRSGWELVGIPQRDSEFIGSALDEPIHRAFRQTIDLLSIFPCILTKLGSRGVILAELLRQGDHRLTAHWARDDIYHHYSYVGWGLDNEPKTRPEGINFPEGYAALYARVIPSAENIGQEDIMSVNGAGDTFLGTIVAGLAKTIPKKIDDLVMTAQKAAVMTLKSKESVSPNIRFLASYL